MVLIYLFLAHIKKKKLNHLNIQRLDDYEIYNNYKQKVKFTGTKDLFFEDTLLS